MASLTVTLPALDSRYGGNSRALPRERNRLANEAKSEAMVEIRDAMNSAGWYGSTHWQPVHLSILWHYNNKGHRPDPDNAISRVKPYIDAAVAAGLIADDNPDHITELTLAYERAATPGIRLTFTLVDEQERQTA